MFYSDFFHSLWLGCERKDDWCIHGGSTYEFKDCDADGFKDHVCSDSEGQSGVIPSSNNCESNWPNGQCLFESK